MTNGAVVNWFLNWRFYDLSRMCNRMACSGNLEAVIIPPGQVTLRSYRTEIARLIPPVVGVDSILFVASNPESPTTARHIAELIKAATAAELPPKIFRIPCVPDGTFSELLLVEKRPWSRWPQWDYLCGYQAERLVLPPPPSSPELPSEPDARGGKPSRVKRRRPDGQASQPRSARRPRTPRTPSQTDGGSHED